jgi:uncharacterized membrane protein YhhN
MELFLILFVLSAAADWFAVQTQRARLEYICKPTALLFLILWFATSLPSRALPIGQWFTLGLALSLAGDVFLMLPDDHFLKGLVAFLLAHVAYITAFNSQGWVFSSLSILMLVVILALAGVLLSRILKGLRQRGRRSMAVPVVVYAIVLAATFWSASTTLLRPSWPVIAGGLSGVGGGLFFISDAAIAWNRFIGPHPGGRVFEMITYHLAQFGLSAGILTATTGSIIT